MGVDLSSKCLIRLGYRTSSDTSESKAKTLQLPFLREVSRHAYRSKIYVFGTQTRVPPLPDVCFGAGGFVDSKTVTHHGDLFTRGIQSFKVGFSKCNQLAFAMVLVRTPPLPLACFKTIECSMARVAVLKVFIGGCLGLAVPTHLCIANNIRLPTSHCEQDCTSFSFFQSDIYFL